MMRFGIRVPLWQRERLTRMLLQHYAGMVMPLRNEEIELILVAVDSQGAAYRKRVNPSGKHWIWTSHPNVPSRIGEKFRAGLLEMRKHNPDAVLNIGSDDFIGIDTIRKMAANAAAGVDFSGFANFYYVHQRHGMRRWRGYPRGTRRHDEPIGAGRCYTTRMLDALNWELWPGAGLGRVDANSWGRAKKLAKTGKFTVRKFTDEELGPMVDVKTKESVTQWRRLKAANNEDVPLVRARQILSQVGLEGYL